MFEAQILKHNKGLLVIDQEGKPRPLALEPLPTGASAPKLQRLKTRLQFDWNKSTKLWNSARKIKEQVATKGRKGRITSLIDTPTAQGYRYHQISPAKQEIVVIKLARQSKKVWEKQRKVAIKLARPSKKV